MRYHRVALLMAGITVAGCCGEHSLLTVSRGHWNYHDQTWVIHEDPRPPRTPEESLAVQVAATGESIKSVDYTAGMVGSDGDEGIVVICREPPTKTERFAPKKVTHYRICAGMVCGSLGPTDEAFPDIEFEKAVTIAASRAMAQSGFSVTLLRNWVQPVTLKAEVHDTCLVDVTVIDGYQPYGNTLCTKVVNMCRPDRKR